MDKIVNLNDRIESKRQKNQIKRHRGKLEAIEKLIQCSSCRLRCTLCSHHVGDKEPPPSSTSSSFGFTFCEACRGEFEDFLAVSRGETHRDVFWHNKEWMDMWAAWLKYRQAINGYLNSREFNALLEELKKEP